MSQHDMNISGAQNGAAFTSDLNNALGAIATNHSGATAPSVTFAYQWWADTTNNLLKIRNAANTAWINTGKLSAFFDSVALTGIPTAPTASVGTNTTQLATTAFVLANSLRLTPNYSSSLTTIAANSNYTFAHGLGSVPIVVRGILRCISADSNYPVGSEIEIGSLVDYVSGVTQVGYTLAADATNIYLTLASHGLNLVNRTSSAVGGVTFTNWRFIAQAWI